MSFGALRSIIRPVSRTLFSSPIKSAFSPATLPPAISPLPAIKCPWIPPSSALIHSLTDTRLPKRRPIDKPRKKRASLRPSGPYAWVKYTPVIQPSATPNQGSSNQKNVKRRNEKKRIKQRHSFIMSEKRKRKVLMQEAKRKKIIKRVERKMSAVARDRAWAIRLAELQRLEEEKKAAATA
ncbi:hypothetical protein DCAR_0729840 [Daucus carota subsp. sativus]|uniref:Uncharacterized protein n=1 Tax=Daucus carota subsp. sativus TaxID=79200 RepID=A0A161X8L3_DAUCS|nr:PREDICTED: uncharacterized protein LOC108194009 [Daucus carota subsp. sativus]WOH10372.1 hypothetical protein DCAR_0729840 [Daucus carota subsp. sativus]